MRRTGILLAVVLAGCGSGGLEGTLEWKAPPRVTAHALSGSAHNTTSHSVTLNSKTMRLLDDHGRKVTGRIRVNGASGSTSLDSDGTARIDAAWRSGKPVRIDYGTGALALPS